MSRLKHNSNKKIDVDLIVIGALLIIIIFILSLITATIQKGYNFKHNIDPLKKGEKKIENINKEHENWILEKELLIKRWVPFLLINEKWIKITFKIRYIK